MTLRLLPLIALLGFLPPALWVADTAGAQNANETVTSAPLPAPSSNPGSNSSLAPPPAGVTLTMPDGSPTLVPGASSSAAPPLRIGFLANAAPGDQQTLMLPFRDHLQLALDRPMEFIPFREARGLVVAMEQKTIAYAIAPGSVLAATQTLCDCVAPLAMQPNGDGSKGLFSVLIAAADGPVGTAEDVRAERLVVVGQDSVIAHQLGLSELWAQDVRLDPGSIVHYAPSLTQAVSLLQSGQGDAILSWTRQADGGVLFAAPPAHQLDEDTRAALRIVWRSRPAPGLSHYAHRDLDAALIDQLQDLVTGLANTNGEAFYAIDQGSGRPFVATSLTDYAPYMDALAYWSR